MRGREREKKLEFGEEESCGKGGDKRKRKKKQNFRVWIYLGL